MKLNNIITRFEVRVSHDHRQLILTTNYFDLLSKYNAVLKLVTLLRVDEILSYVFIWMNILNPNGDSRSLPHGLQLMRHAFCATRVKNVR